MKRLLTHVAIAAGVLVAGLVAGPAIAQQGGKPPPASYWRKAAPEPYVPAGPLHFVGLAVDAGVFVDPASVTRGDGKAQARVLKVHGRIWQTADGDIRWTWDQLDVNCAARTWDRTISDFYGHDGAWIGGFDGPALETVHVQIASDEALLAYLCDGTQPQAFQIVPGQDSAVAGIVNAFADQ